MVTEGAPDYRHLRVIQGKDALGNLVILRVDDSGRIIMIPYGDLDIATLPAVDQADPTRTMQGADGVTLHTIAVDGAGRIIMIPYGDLDIASLPAVDQADPTRTMQGADGVTLHTIAVDASGRLIMLPYGWDGATYRPLKVDDEGRMIGVMKGQADVKWGLRGWWKFVAAEGTTIKDYSGYGYNGSAFSGVEAEAKYVGGVINQALQFDGVDDYVDCGTLDTYGSELSTKAMTVFEGWIKSSVTDTVMMPIGISNNLDNTTIMLALNEGWPAGVSAGIIGVFLRDKDGLALTGKVNYNTGITDGDWHHLTVNINGPSDEVKVYVDTQLQTFTYDTQTTPVNVTDFEFSWFIGANDGRGTANNFFGGLLDEIRIYDRALSQDEINWRYAQTDPTNPKPTRMIAVDSEGRMQVNVEGLPYKDQVLERGSYELGAAGSHDLQSSVVPTGKLWVITNALMAASAVMCTLMQISIFDGSSYYANIRKFSAGAVEHLEIQGQLTLKAGDCLYFTWGTVSGATILEWSMNGYELDVV
jgi:hypothetical protein